MIETTAEADVTYVTVDRPHRRNALTPDGLDALQAAIEECETPVICLHGAGSAFCAGADLDVVADLDHEEATAFAEQGQRVARVIEESTAVVVAAIDGAARGGGVELALACDLRVATPNATFAETGVRLGLFGAWGGTHRLPRVVGEGNAMDLALSGRTVDTEEALRMGLVSRISDDPSEVAREVAASDPVALERLQPLLRQQGTAADRERAEREVFAALVTRNAGTLRDG
ncbi:enoyl-CoA hydratase/isomerase family protein [Halococcus saccharolyticus]|uniref:Enoyl-CoA hydratase n=1 Tax=Halococcus saccharolyticus DSM 5350 TaxID=1227455 RepID=M0MDQ5_9EURY|nr:enoyl-CoA hydratase/isomerase family protein [Halococcus saccharolyticus]EMA42510.1 enoyl-CoA hydratase [Halococcus saccharolyticus DSM 5350]